jgi:nucleoside-diphosphate-sugar epimerase
MPSALVTGASGFIGSHLLERLRAGGYAVRGTVRATSRRDKIDDAAGGEAFDLREAPLSDIDALALAVSGTDVVFHVAGITAAFTRDDFERVNTGGCANVFTAIERAKSPPKRVVLVSSLMAAGPNQPGVARREAHRHDEGRSQYGDSKLGGERLGWEVAQAGRTEVVIVRPPLVYGPRDEDVLQMIKSANARVIAQPTLRAASYSAIHVHDLIDGIIAAGDRGRPLPRLDDASAHVLGSGGLTRDTADSDPLHPAGEGIYYLTDGDEHTIASFGRAAAKACGKSAITLPMPGFLVMSVGAMSQLAGRIRGKVPPLTIDKARASCAEGWWCDDARARDELGFTQRYDLASGLEHTVAWYRERGIL